MYMNPLILSLYTWRGYVGLSTNSNLQLSIFHFAVESICEIIIEHVLISFSTLNYELCLIFKLFN
jgi:hypothetical protein